MTPIAISCIMFVCVFGGALLGMFLRSTLPEHHQSTDSKDVLKLLIGLIGTMAALVIGLLIATAASSFATRRSEFTQMSANIVLLDLALAHYGPETKETRDLLKRAVARELQLAQPEDRTASPAKFDPTASGAEILFDKIQQLVPRNDVQRSLQAQLLTMAINLGQTRWLLFEQSGRSIPIPFLVVLVFWLEPHFRDIRSVCASQCDRRCRSAPRRTIRFSCDLPDSGAGLAIRGTDTDLRRTLAQGSRPSRSVAR